MTRDMDLIRELLLKLEALPVRLGGTMHLSPTDEEVTIEGFSSAQIDYHLSLIKEAGFIDDGNVRPMVGTGFRRLSWEGHDFLDSIRSPEVWAKTKKTTSAVGGFTIQLLKDLATGLIKHQIEQHVGFKI